MKQRILFLIILFPIVMMCGCSYRYDFVVINESDRTIEVQYQLKRDTLENPGKFADIDGPAKVTLREFKEAEYKWQKLAKGQYEFDTLTGTFKVSVAPDEVLLVDSTNNHGGDENWFAFASIKIDGVNGAIELEGRQAQTQFRLEDTKYILRYR